LYFCTAELMDSNEIRDYAEKDWTSEFRANSHYSSSHEALQDNFNSDASSLLGKVASISEEISQGQKGM